MEFFRGSNDFIEQKVSAICVGLIMVSCLFLSLLLITSRVLLNRAESKAACRLQLIILNRRYIGIKSAVRQAVFTDAQITIRQTVAVLPVLGYWSELCSYWLTRNKRWF